jgi:glyoxalase family protein
MPQGIRGNGEVAAISYSIPLGAVDYWRDRLTGHGLTVQDEVRFGVPALVFEDPDGLTLELIAETEDRAVRDWAAGPIPPQFALRGFYGVTIWVGDARRTARLLTEIMGYERVTQEGNRYHFRASSEERGAHVDLLEKPGLPYAKLGAGSVHHVAFRTVNDEEQIEYQQAVADTGLRVTPVQDRQYFCSIYFREPGGVLFEIATDEPGFLIDETVEELGTALRLPPWLESNRQQIERSLPPITIPTVETGVLHDR